jgi:ferrous iron transport protein B
MFLLTLFSWVMVLVVSRLLRWTVLAGEATPFVMELPPYRLPTLYGVAAHTWERIWQYIKKAGTVILVISILMWAAMTFPQLPEREQAQFQTAREALETRLTGADGPEAQALRQRLATLERAEQQAAVKNSLAGRAALGLESVTQYAGFPWQANIALLGAFTAKEVFVSTMATVYAKGEYGEPEGETLSRKLRDDPAFTRPAVLSLFIFLLLYAPCTVTLSVIMRETSFKWGIMGLVVSLTVAYALSVAVYQIGMLL